MERDKMYDDLLRKRISDIMGEPVDENANADDVMFDLGLRYLRMKAQAKRINASKKANRLSLWVKDAASRKALTDYVESVTDKSGPDYIPPTDRIAIFDLDGTLYCESDPTWFDFMLYKHRILEDPDYRDRATDYEKGIAATVQSVIDTGVVPEGFEVEIGSCIARAFAGMSVGDFNQCPVLSFGNSTGDISMTNFVMGNEKYKTAAFFVCCDDGVREKGSPEKAQKVYDFCAENGWTPISMKNDWLTVFGEGVTKKQ